MASSPLPRLRQICLSLREAHEVEAWGEPTFRVRNRMFATYARPDSHHGGGCPAVWCKSTSFDQDQLIRANPKRFFAPPYVGHKGWVGMRLNGRPNWTMVTELLRAAHRLTAQSKKNRGVRVSRGPRG